MVRNLLKLATCLLFGHDGEPTLGNLELFQRCRRCGRRSPGWQITGHPKRKYDGKPEVTQAVTLPWHYYQGPPDSIDHMDQITANLLADLDLAGRDGDVQLLLLPPVNQLKH